MNTMWLDLLGSQVRFYGRQFKTRVIESGDGDLLVLIHGVGGHAEAYSRNVTRLGKYYRTMAIDLLWHGLSAKPPYNDRSVPTYAEQIVNLLDSLGVERAHIEGESLGGWVGLWFALHHPDRLGKLILNTTAGVAYDPVKVKERPEEGRSLLRQRSMEAIENPSRETIRKRLEWLMASPDRVTEELVELRYRMYADPDTRRALKDVFRNSFGDGDSKTFRIPTERLSEIKAPTLVLWTEKNPGAGPEVGEYIRSLIPGAAYACIPDAAHWPQWEHPEEHDEIVLKFLKGEL
ncbi:MAG TPA: alpha/beta hydrolase [Candidatus Binatia bacterium]|jgi:pimeloyl-ACP methyl ester carboxylesterase|nr:alpha/beta hydrolase [Candidatus Binatia bacterium]